jgi:radical SAM protein with 4Fe4S-binding SPASM domain
MSLETAKKIIDWTFENKPADREGYEIRLFGGEPLLQFDLIKEIVNYVKSKKIKDNYILFSSTNGTLLTDEIKQWCTENKDVIDLGLSLDGKKITQDYNRSNSFNSIDIDYFIKTWPGQSAKMTISEFSLPHLAENIIYLYSLGFKDISGVNLFEGDFDWDKEEYIRILIPQLKELVKFHIENDTLKLNQMFRYKLNYCEAKTIDIPKYCGVGTNALFFDTDGKKYPCPFITPMTFPLEDVEEIMKIDFTNIENFKDEECAKNCYLYPVCPTCAGVNYMLNKSFKIRNKRKCRLFKLIILFVADLQGKLLMKNPDSMDDTSKYYTIEAIKKIYNLYYNDFKKYFDV